MDLPVTVSDREPGRPDGPRFLQHLPHWLAQALPAWLPRQRWFGSKGRVIGAVRLRAAARLPGEEAGALALVDIECSPAGATETYFLPLLLQPESAAAEIEAERVSRPPT